MNFIDKALENKLRGDDFLQVMANIYKESDVREILSRYPQFIRDVILIIDYDTNLVMNGLDDIVNGSMKSQLPELLTALDNCGNTYEANILRLVKKLKMNQDEEFEELYNKLALNNNYDEFWDFVKSYIDKNLDEVTNSSL